MWPNACSTTTSRRIIVVTGTRLTLWRRGGVGGSMVSRSSSNRPSLWTPQHPKILPQPHGTRYYRTATATVAVPIQYRHSSSSTSSSSRGSSHTRVVLPNLLLERLEQRLQAASAAGGVAAAASNSAAAAAELGLSPTEQDLLEAWRDHRRCVTAEHQHEPPQSQSQQEAIVPSLSRLRDCYVAMEYWDYALQTEQELEDVVVLQQQQHNQLQLQLDQQAASWYRQGLYQRRLGQRSMATQLWHAARDYYQQKQQQLRNNDPHNNPTTTVVTQKEPMLGQVLISLAGVDFGRGRYQEAAQQLAQAEPHCVANVNMWVECLQHQGLVYQSMNDENEYDDNNNNSNNNEDRAPQDTTPTHVALAKYRQAIQLLEQVKTKSDPNNIHANDMDLEDIENRVLELQLTVADLLASMEDQPQQLQEAQHIYESLLDTHCATADNDDDDSTSANDNTSALEASLRYKLGKLLLAQHDNENDNDVAHCARNHLQRAVALERRTAQGVAPAGVSLSLAHSLNGLGAAHAALQQHAAARPCFREALLLAQLCAGHERASHDPLVIQILGNLDTLQQEHQQQQQEHQQPQQQQQQQD